MADIKDFHFTGKTAWCPGCGDFGILQSVEKALVNAGKKPEDVLLVSGIGQAAKLPHYIHTNGFNGLHGRALPAAFGAKVANHKLTVIVTSGDGDLYGEGGNHFIHNLRRNIDITVVAHDNQIYGLTKGQASPTSDIGMRTVTQPEGVISSPFNPLAIAILLGAPFVARSFSRETELTADLIREGIATPGFALIDVLQPCVTFNKVNTYQWYRERVYRLEESYDPTDKAEALMRALEITDKLPIGVLYKNPGKSYLDNVLSPGAPPLVDRRTDRKKLQALLEEFY